jgi:hypothetical protein
MPEGHATCAIHRDRPSVMPCVRCGNFACADCFGVDGRCPACVAREEPSVPDGSARAQRAQLGLGINAVIEGIGILVALARLAAGPPSSGQGEVALGVLGMTEACHGLLQFAAIIVTAVLFCQWWHRMVRQAHRSGLAQDVTPGWAVGYWFIPFVNLVRPYRIARAVSDGLDAAAPVSAWWTCWIISNVLANVSARMGWGETPASVAQAATVIGLFGSFFSVPAALLGLQVVKRIQARLSPAVAQSVARAQLAAPRA